MRKRVLLIEDETFVARAFSRHLGEHDVCIATSGKDALALLKEDARFDVIVCDLAMPEMDGVMVHDAIAVDYPGLERRMVFCSGGAQSARVRDFLKRTQLPLMEKPLSGAMLRSAVRGVLSTDRNGE